MLLASVTMPNQIALFEEVLVPPRFAASLCAVFVLCRLPRSAVVVVSTGAGAGAVAAITPPGSYIDYRTVRIPLWTEI